VAKTKIIKIKKVVLFTIVIMTMIMTNVADAKLKITAPGPITQEATGIVTHITDLGIPKITGGKELPIPGGKEPYTNDAPTGNNFPVGVTTVTWTTTDVGNVAVTDTQLVTIKDTTAPSITVNGINPITIHRGDVYTDAGASAIDTVDGDITKNILVNNSVNSDIVGTYTVTYDVNDSAGNNARQEVRTVNVLPVVLNITSYSPNSSLIEEPAPSHVKFGITTNRPVNILWRLDGVSTPGGQSVTQDFYDTNIPIIGSHTITVIAQNGTDSISQTWTLDVKGTLKISASPSSVNIGKPTDVVLKVSRICGIEAADNSSCTGSYIPVTGANIDITGISGSGVTNDTGVFITTINATTNETINVTASKSGYISGSIVISEITPVPTPHQSSSSGSSSSSSSGSSSSSSSGSSSGGDISSPESFSNIIKFERHNRDLVYNTPVTYSFSSAELAIYQVLVTGSSNDIDVDMRVEHLKNVSDTISTIPEGVIYANENVWLGSARINSATLRFRVKNSWLTANGLDKGNIMLLRYNDGWKNLQTNITNNDGNYTYFESISPGLSSFAISGLKTKNIITQTVSNVSRAEFGNTPSPVATEVVKKKNVSMWFEIGVVMISIIVIAYFIRMKK
jgi:PGF-pre-PGF domain-containing protein